jgi:hypothetical protein
MATWTARRLTGFTRNSPPPYTTMSCPTVAGGGASSAGMDTPTGGSTGDGWPWHRLTTAVASKATAGTTGRRVHFGHGRRTTV